MNISKHFTYRNAAILGWIGLALVIASFFLNGWQERTTYITGFLLGVISMCASYHQRGYNKGIQEAHAERPVVYSTLTFHAGEFNVKDYGAKGDGVTDDTAAVQAAFDAANEAAKSHPFRGLNSRPRGTK